MALRPLQTFALTLALLAFPAAAQETGDPAAGETLWPRCAGCHALESGAVRAGPHLDGIVGRPVASVEGYGYSDALAAHGGDWTVEELTAYLAAPREDVPGTRKSMPPLGEADARNMVAYLATLGE